MARFPDVDLLVILGCATINSSATAASLSIEDKLNKELESRLETKINLLEAKNVQLETQIKKNNEDREELASQVTELKAKVQQQETILSALLNEKNEPSANLNNLVNTHQSQAAINGLPSSCADLKMIGHIWSGFYSVMGNTTMESVYCDFTKTPSDAGFQKWIGYADVKSAPVYFHVIRTSAYDTTGVQAIPFDGERLNVGNAMDVQSGIFTAPRPGTYFFSFTTEAEFVASSSTLRATILFLKNGGEVGRADIVETNTVAYQKSPLTLQATLNLISGDQVWLFLSNNLSPGVNLNGDGYPFTHFVGFMLEEEIVASL